MAASIILLRQDNARWDVRRLEVPASLRRAFVRRLAGMPEPCWAFLAADFEAAAHRAKEAVARLQRLAEAPARAGSGELSEAPTRTSLEGESEWVEAQHAIAAQLTALAALEDAGLSVPADALATARRAQADFARLAARE